MPKVSNCSFTTIIVVSQCRCVVLTWSEDQDRMLLAFNLLGLNNLVAQSPGTFEFYQNLL